MEIYDDDDWMIQGIHVWRASASKHKADGDVWHSISCGRNTKTGKPECYRDAFNVLGHIWDKSLLSQKNAFFRITSISC